MSCNFMETAVNSWFHIALAVKRCCYAEIVEVYMF